VYAANGRDATVSVISGATDTVTTNLLYISRTGTGTGEGVTAYDGTTLAPVGEVSLPGNPLSLEDNPDTGTVYAALYSAAGQETDLINGASTTVTGTMPVSGSGWIAVEPATDTLVYAANVNTGGAVWVIPLTTPAISSRAAATFTTDIGARFTVTVTGTPAPVLTEKGTLPYEVRCSPTERCAASRWQAPAAYTRSRSQPPTGWRPRQPSGSR
jgi:hypothetical protein